MTNLDEVFKELGQFGKYQVYIFVLLFFPIVLFGASSVAFVFTTAHHDYRCFIPECEDIGSRLSDNPGLRYAMPFQNGKIVDQCLRYKPASNSSSRNCSKESFTSEIEECDKFIFGDTSTITRDFNLLCEKNMWKISLIGSMGSIGLFIGTLISGVLADRFGRKTLIIWSLTISSLFGILRTFSTEYWQYALTEALIGLFMAGVFNSAYVAGTEAVGPDRRTIGGALINSYYGAGEIFLAVIVWLVNDWRLYLRIIYTSCLIVATLYIWNLPESLRWLIAFKKRDKVKETIKQIAEWNNKHINDEMLSAIEELCPDEVTTSKNSEEEKSIGVFLKELIKSRRILLRGLNCCFCWITTAVIYLGLSFNAVSLSGNMYLNFILVSLVEFPANAIYYFLAKPYGRKMCLNFSLALCGAACLTFYFIPQGYTALSLLIYFTGKVAVTIATSALFGLASEMFPTCLRNFLLGLCSSTGMLGLGIAPQTLLLAKYVDPVLVYSGLSFTAAALGLFFPETRNQPLPETVKDAENM